MLLILPSCSAGPGFIRRERSDDRKYGCAWQATLIVIYRKNELFVSAGYGNIVPITVQGRLFCVLYALIGIRGTCLTLKAVGD